MSSLWNIIPNHLVSFVAVWNFCNGYWVIVTLIKRTHKIYHIRFPVISTWLTALVSYETSNGKGDLVNLFCLLFSIYILYTSVKATQLFLKHNKENSEVIINNAQCGPLLNTISSYRHTKLKWLIVFNEGRDWGGGGFIPKLTGCYYFT
jgi:hypothetical protein